MIPTTLQAIDTELAQLSSKRRASSTTPEDFATATARMQQLSLHRPAIAEAEDIERQRLAAVEREARAVAQYDGGIKPLADEQREQIAIFLAAIEAAAKAFRRLDDLRAPLAITWAGAVQSGETPSADAQRPHPATWSASYSPALKGPQADQPVIFKQTGDLALALRQLALHRFFEGNPKRVPAFFETSIPFNHD